MDILDLGGVGYSQYWQQPAEGYLYNANIIYETL